MSTRVLTNKQFSNNTTIDGSRIETALEDIKVRYNSPDFRDVDMWVENKFAYGYTPPLIETNLRSWQHGAPFIFCWESNMVPAVPGYEGPNNEFRFKGAGILDPYTGIPTFGDDLGGGPYDLSWFWTATQYFVKPTIIQDFTMFGLYDDRSDTAVTPANKYYGCEWVVDNGTSLSWERDYALWVVIDNPQNTGDTFIRNSEVHLWACSAQGLMMNPRKSVPNVYTDERVQYNILVPSASVQKINGNAIRLHNLNIPVFAGSRVRFVFGLPAIGKTFDPNEPNTGRPQANSAFYGDQNNEPVWNNKNSPTFSNNLWCMNISVLEPLEKIKDE